MAIASVEALCVSPGYVPHIWPHVSHYIRRAMQRGGLGDFADVERDVRSGLFLLWIAWDGSTIVAAAVTQLSVANDEKTCTIVACGGVGLKRIAPLISTLEQFARTEGCIRTRICGRRGWSRALPGYAVKRVIIEKELA